MNITAIVAATWGLWRVTCWGRKEKKTIKIQDWKFQLLKSLVTLSWMKSTSMEKISVHFYVQKLSRNKRIRNNCKRTITRELPRGKLESGELVIKY